MDNSELPRSPSSDESAYWHEVLRISYSVARNLFRLPHDEAEDIAQEMALRLVKRLRVADVNGAWVFKGARFLCIDHLRAAAAERAMRERHAVEAWRRTTGGTTSAPETAYYELTSVIRSLSLDSQSLIRQYFWEGKSWEEIDVEIYGGQRKSQYRGRLCLSRIRKVLGHPESHG